LPTSTDTGAAVSDAAASGPLAGIRVLDAAHVIAGPGIAARLGDFGADVVKIEHPQSGDTTRSLGWSANDTSLWWKHLGRNKRSVTLDLSHPRGQDVFVGLAERCDVLVESFRPGTMERWNLGPDRLMTANPRLVYARVSGFGQDGPAAARPGFGTLAEALCGYVHMTGFPAQPPVLPPIALADEISALVGAYAVMVALHHRDCSGGVGQIIDVALTDSLLQLLGPLALAYDVLGAVPQRMGNRLPYAAPRGVYQARDGRWLALSGTSQSVALRLLRVVGGDELAGDPRFSSNESRLANVEQLDRIISDWLSTRHRDEALAEFEAAGVAAAPIYDIEDVFNDAQYAARGALVAVDDPDLGPARTVAPQPKLSATPARIKHLGRHLGDDTEAVLLENGYERSEIAQLRRDGVI
jgi:crotonobetainyl-CoA:carnitine CoA-transferase CaiB-like acyl-CoA transferase